MDHAVVAASFVDESVLSPLHALLATVWKTSQLDTVLSPGVVTCYTVNPQGLHSMWPLLCLWTWNIFFWWVPVASCPWLFNSWLQFWCSRRRTHILPLPLPEPDVCGGPRLSHTPLVVAYTTLQSLQAVSIPPTRVLSPGAASEA